MFIKDEPIRQQILRCPVNTHRHTPAYWTASRICSRLSTWKIRDRNEEK